MYIILSLSTQGFEGGRQQTVLKLKVNNGLRWKGTDFELEVMVESPVCLCPGVPGMQQLVAGLEAGAADRSGVTQPVPGHQVDCYHRSW